LLNFAASAVIRSVFCAAHLAWNFLAWWDAAQPDGLEIRFFTSTSHCGQIQKILFRRHEPQDRSQSANFQGSK